MRNEHDKNLKVLQVIMQLCEEGASDELNDGSDGNEPWTEEDRRNSRASEAWLQSTFFTTRPRSKARNKLRTLIGEQLFSDEQLWEQLDSGDEYRRECAIEAIDALATLAAIRARDRGTSFLVERHSVFDARLLATDMRASNSELRDAALNAWDHVSHIAALVEADRTELTDAERHESHELREWALARLAELKQAAEERREDGAQ